MNPSTFYGSNVDEDPQGFIEEMFKVVDAMGVSSQVKAELGAYQLKDVAQVWYEQWKDERPVRVGPVDWRSEEGKGRFEVQGKPRFKKRFSNQGFSSTPRVNKDRESNPKPQGGNSGGSYVERPSCANCGKKHEGKFLVGIDGCFSYGKSSHMKRDYPMLKVQGDRASKSLQVAQILMLPRIITSMLSNPEGTRTW
ncbi:uncharacterized protein LOC125833533 [Solanum verrucosum]|uniref:uncharacterized protein LOC125833533 n=1 Tax=Solanum verrucosum TaxID=315347 RepID=UPI0020D0603A|nr:uncharacterized protein LOC125833533 [Solanum verrucosum]